jgi:S1-C subfamily serine protease
MKMRIWAASVLLCSSGAAQAADWWWIGLNGSAPNRVLTYVDRETIHPGNNGTVEAWAFAVGETHLPNGQQHQATHYGFRCRQGSFATLGRIAYGEAGNVLPLMDVPPSAYAPVEANSIGESVLRVACGRPAGTEVHVEQPVQHALAYLGEHALAAAGPEGAQQAPAPEARQQEAENTGPSVGTGFFVGPDGFVLTSYHVVDGATRVECRTGDGVVHEAAMARMSQMNDLALLRVDARPTRYLGLAPRGSPHPGERVFTIGYGAPNFLGINEPRFTEGAISALSGVDAEDAYMQISVPIQPGNSGGPVVNEAGQVVGIIAAQAATQEFVRIEGTLPQSINWAVKADYAAPLLPRQPPAPRLTRAQAIDLTRDSICFIVAQRAGEPGKGE